jgi:hypothetical protein
MKKACMDVPLRYAELASKSSDPTSKDDDILFAWKNLKRLRHSLESMVEEGIPESNISTNSRDSELFRLLQCVAPYILGEREVTFNVDSDALRCWILLLDLGIANILCEKDIDLLLNIGSFVMARALSIISENLQQQWLTSPYTCDICGLATATLVVQLSTNISVRNAKVKELGTKLHASLKKLGSLRDEKVLQTSETMDHLQVAYMSALQPASGPCSSFFKMFAGSPMALIPIVLPIICAYAIMMEGGKMKCCC